jgi:hypothetical protein
MSTLVAVYNSDGCVGRCDAKCYNAKGDKCTCICGGANHGKGMRQAVENTARLASKWIDEYCREHPGTTAQLSLDLAYPQEVAHDSG